MSTECQRTNMAVYINRDIETSLEGDIELDTNGDLKLADPLQTYKSAANFLLRTDYGDYSPDRSVGCNLGSFIGKTNVPSTREFMENNINKVLQNRLYTLTDAIATVVPFDINEVLCVVNIGGSYLIDGTIRTVTDEKIAYTFPFIDGRYITPITIT